MSKSQRQLTLLGVLLGALAVTLVLRSGETTPAAAPAVTRSTPAADAPPRTVPVLGLRLDLLTAKPDDLSAASRNPFRFLPRPASTPRVAPVAAAAPLRPPAPEGPPPPPPIPLKFIGVLDAPARVGRLAILSDSRGGVFYGKEGDTIEGRYRVLRISTDVAELAYLDGRGRQTIRLSGQ